MLVCKCILKIVCFFVIQESSNMVSHNLYSNLYSTLSLWSSTYLRRPFIVKRPALASFPNVWEEHKSLPNSWNSWKLMKCPVVYRTNAFYLRLIESYLGQIKSNLGYIQSYLGPIQSYLGLIRSNYDKFSNIKDKSSHIGQILLYIGQIQSYLGQIK